ncbi:MAG: DUF370 domain-containing protein [Clostridia bacterium]|nr:DUF370 domain-containing protein [Clostridia bacterium]
MMVLHIGNGVTVRVRDLVAFFDFDVMTVASISRRFLSDAEKKKMISDCAGGELPRSVLLVSNGKEKKPRILFSLLSTAALRARLASGEND